MTKIAVITGAGGGIGHSLSMKLLASDMDIKIIAIGRGGDKLEALHASNPDRVQIITADIGTPEGRNHILYALSHYQYIDYLVHGAATAQPLSTIKNLSLTQWRNLFHTNVEGPLFLTQMLLSKFNHSRVLFFTSEISIQAVHGASSYCMSKAAQQILYQSFQIETPTEQAIFSLVSPGLVDTPMQEKLRHADPTELPAATELTQCYNEKKLLTAETVAKFVSWLLLTVDKDKFGANIWDIYQESHHSNWLSTKKPSHTKTIG